MLAISQYQIDSLLYASNEELVNETSPDLITLLAQTAIKQPDNTESLLLGRIQWACPSYVSQVDPKLFENATAPQVHVKVRDETFSLQKELVETVCKERLGQVTSLDLKHLRMGNVADRKAFWNFVKSLPNLRHLAIGSGMMFKPTDFESLFECSNLSSTLVSLDLSSIEISADPFTDLSVVLDEIPDYFPQLTRLNLSNTKINKAALTSICQLKQLTCLDISSCSKLTEASDIAGLKNATKLKFLNMDNLSFSTQSLQHISRLRNLTHLSIRNYRPGNLEAIQQIAKARQLTHLDCYGWNETSLEMARVLQGNLQNLVLLNIFNPYKKAPEGCFQTLSSIPNLSHLSGNFLAEESLGLISPEKGFPCFEDWIATEESFSIR